MLFHSTLHSKIIFTQILTRNLLVLMPTIKASFSKIFGRPETKFKWSNAKLSFHQCSKKCTKKLPQVWKKNKFDLHNIIAWLMIIIFLTIFFFVKLKYIFELPQAMKTGTNYKLQKESCILGTKYQPTSKVPHFLMEWPRNCQVVFHRLKMLQFCWILGILSPRIILALLEVLQEIVLQPGM